MVWWLCTGGARGGPPRIRFLQVVSTLCFLAGLCFGYTTGVMTGIMRAITQDINGFKSSRDLTLTALPTLFPVMTFGECSTDIFDSFEIASMVSAVVIGAVVGSIVSGFFADRYGRRPCAALFSVIVSIGSVGSACSPLFAILLAFRFICGVGVGGLSVVIPVYTAEVAPRAVRGSLIAIFQMAITAGIFIGYQIDYVSNLHMNWRWALGIGAFPSAMLTAVVLYEMPESPRYLINKSVERLYGSSPHRSEFASDNNLRKVRVGTASSLNSSSLSHQSTPITSESSQQVWHAPGPVNAPVPVREPSSSFESARSTPPSRYYSTDALVDSIEAKDIDNSIMDESNILKNDDTRLSVPSNHHLSSSIEGPSVDNPPLTLIDYAGRAHAILSVLYGDDKADDKILSITSSVKNETGTFSDILSGPGLRFLLLTCVLAMAQQLSGINSIMYYLPCIFEITQESSAATKGSSYITLTTRLHEDIATVVTGMVNMASSVICVWCVDRIGRRRLEVTGLFGMAISLFSFGFLLHFSISNNSTDRSGVPVKGLLACLFICVTFFEIGPGAMFWILTPELLPGRIRARASGMVIAFQWALNMLVSMSFPLLKMYLGSNVLYVFIGYGAIAMACGSILWYFLPETKGRGLEDIICK